MVQRCAHSVLSEAELQAFAADVAAVLLPGDCVALRGDLGAGKSTFARALIRAFLGDPGHDVPSPTFALRQDYAGPRGSIAHFDLYRLTAASELDELGFDETLATAISIVEWPERAASLLPREHLEVALTEGASTEARLIEIGGSGRAVGAVAALLRDRNNKAR
jgi:tRNA threonylcarbamoyl adenosine modification protein YjeE